MQSHLLYHTKMWRSCKLCLFLINLRRLNHCIKFLPCLNDCSLMTSKGLTLSDTQLCGIMMRGCKKKWDDQYNANVGWIPTNFDILLKKFEVYKNLTKESNNRRQLHASLWREGVATTDPTRGQAVVAATADETTKSRDQDFQKLLQALQRVGRVPHQP